VTEPDPITQRLEHQISWYDRNSLKAQRIRGLQSDRDHRGGADALCIGAWWRRHRPDVGVFGAVITVIEGMIRVNQHQ
jgi:hypothetical protein